MTLLKEIYEYCINTNPYHKDSPSYEYVTMILDEIFGLGLWHRNAFVLDHVKKWAKNDVPDSKFLTSFIAPICFRYHELVVISEELGIDLDNLTEYDKIVLGIRIQ